MKFPVITNVLHLRGERNLKGRGDKKKKEEKRGHKPCRFRSQGGRQLEMV